jgi:hypothetical protein
MKLTKSIRARRVSTACESAAGSPLAPHWYFPTALFAALPPVHVSYRLKHAPSQRAPGQELR